MLKELYKELGISDDHAGGDQIALNTMPWERKEYVKLADGRSYGVAEGSGGAIAVTLNEEKEPGVTVREIKKGVFVLKNDQLTVQVDGGHITSLYDHNADREIIPKGSKANQLVIFDDKPLYWQAWDVEVFHLDSRKELPTGHTSIIEQTAHRISLMTETKISEQSWIKTTISLSAAFKGQQSYVEMAAEVEWRESMKFLKVEFPVDVRNTEASYETQFGVVRRPTHYNTT